MFRYSYYVLSLLALLAAATFAMGLAVPEKRWGSPPADICTIVGVVDVIADINAISQFFKQSLDYSCLKLVDSRDCPSGC